MLDEGLTKSAVTKRLLDRPNSCENATITIGLAVKRRTWVKRDRRRMTKRMTRKRKGKRKRLTENEAGGFMRSELVGSHEAGWRSGGGRPKGLMTCGEGSKSQHWERPGQTIVKWS